MCSTFLPTSKNGNLTKIIASSHGLNAMPFKMSKMEAFHPYSPCWVLAAMPCEVESRAKVQPGGTLLTLKPNEDRSCTPRSPFALGAAAQCRQAPGPAQHMSSRSSSACSHLSSTIQIPALASWASAQRATKAPPQDTKLRAEMLQTRGLIVIFWF